MFSSPSGDAAVGRVQAQLLLGEGADMIVAITAIVLAGATPDGGGRCGGD